MATQIGFDEFVAEHEPRAPIERLAPSLTDRTRSARPEPWAEPQLEPALDLLSENQRVAVVLRHSFEWTYDEIAELLDISVSTVRNHLNRGLEKLRQSLEVDPS
ncbi:MAG: RNA polymerase sigma factor [Actinomycetia bacterium]|nr:RNA polymerase sigma factor [Actinomycetes bacterium]